MGMPLIWHRRQAMVLAGQLPESTEDALLVMECMRELLEDYLSKSSHEPALKQAGNVLPFSMV